jgi:arylsulfatase A-like enzyme
MYQFNRSLSVVLAASLCVASACAPRPSRSTDDRPNVLWVIWDTVRADRLGVYGYKKPTTPRLDRWAREARVFEQCASTAGQTLPSTASMFTGLLPSEHGTNPAWPRLEDRFTTIAELFGEADYRTYLFSANAYLSREHNFHRGFQVEEHPWDPAYRDEAMRIVREKLASGDVGGMQGRLRGGQPRDGDLKSAGALARVGLERWLERSDPDRPFFVFLNYMEAHRPYIPPREYRERVMDPAQVAESYGVTMQPWLYTFGLYEHSPREIELINGVYDAAIAELDDRLAELLESLEASGNLKNTIVVLTSDHGEHMGEHHRLEHQFSVYEGLIHIPLIVHYPERFAAGRDPRPVSGIDLFPTLLELAGLEPPPGLVSTAVSLLAPDDERVRLAEYPVAHPSVDNAARRFPDWDPGPFRRLLRAAYHGGMKQITADDGHRELYRYRSDPRESDDLTGEAPEASERMSRLMRELVSSLDRWEPEGPAPEMSPEQFERLKALGYVGAE